MSDPLTRRAHEGVRASAEGAVFGIAKVVRTVYFSAFTHISFPRVSRWRVSPVVTILYVVSGVSPGNVHLPFTGTCGFQILTHSGVWS